MHHIRRFLRRESRWLLNELGADSFGTLAYRAAFAIAFTAIVGATLVGILLVEYFLGLLAAAAVVFLLFLCALRMEGNAPAYGDDWPDQPRLPPNGRMVLPGSRIDNQPPRLSRSRTPRIPPPG